MTDLGFSAFAERNQPRYTRYAGARLSRDADVQVAVHITFGLAGGNWPWLLSQPVLAAAVWAELRHQVEARLAKGAAPDDDAAALYKALPRAKADSVLLCHRLDFDVEAAAELMGVEPPAVEAILRAAKRTPSPLAERKDS
ncbi:hypothetical protein ACFC36_00805 [Streptomyces rubiginosohelvolus]|uniref:hypothetical protein n=1 Tax=Streptomyces rubiginosohelvolus TaxID=67362 RepID=UPI0035D98EED